MPTRSTAINPSDLTSLATLANDKLLPLVNAAINPGSMLPYNPDNSTWPEHAYDVVDYTLGRIAWPQPDYNFDTEFFTLASVTVANGGHNYAPGDSLMTVGGTLAAGASQANILVSSVDGAGKITGVYINFIAYYAKPLLLNGGWTVLPASPNAVSGGSGSGATIALTFTSNWVDELNRIRGDYWTLIFNSGLGADDLYQDPDNILSGPWVVGVNDIDTFPMGISPSDTSLQGTLFGSAPDTSRSLTAPNFCYFKNVEFWFAQNDALGTELELFGSLVVGLPTNTTIAMNSYRLLNLDAANTLPTETATLGLNINSSVAGMVTLFIEFDFQLWTLFPQGSPVPPAPDIADLDFAATPVNFGLVTLTSYVNSGTPLSGAQAWTATYHFTGTVNLDVSSGDNPVVFSLLIPKDTMYYGYYGYHGWNFNLGGATVTLRMDVETVTSQETMSALHPKSLVQRLKTSVNDFPVLKIGSVTSGDYYANVLWQISDPTIKGVWIANTLPTPALNVFIAQDMPPYVGFLMDNDYIESQVAVSATLPYFWITSDYDLDNPPTAQPDNNSPSWLDSMRQQALLAHGSKWNLIAQSEQCQPAQWLVRRDTDFVPFNFGFNIGDAVDSYQNLTLAPGGYGYFSLAVPVNAASVKIRLAGAGTGQKGWKNGILQYGTALTDALAIYVSRSATYDFVTNNNAVTIPNDGGAGYLASIRNGSTGWLVYNPTNHTISFDLITEIDYVTTPARQYFPACWECFSYSTDGTPWITQDSDYPMTSEDTSKPIPQSGYCIFKIRATRLPVKNAAGISITPSSGDEIVITLGQNKLQPGPLNIVGALPVNPGLGYGSGQILVVTGGVLAPGGSPGNLMVDSVDAEGRILSAHVSSPGFYSESPPLTGNPVTSNGGTGATFNLTASKQLIFEPFSGAGDVTGAGDTGTGAGSGDVGAGGVPQAFTIKIPANARDTGDIDVFWPVLGGNELVYQCQEQVILEAWANWQPAFNFGYYGRFPYTHAQMPVYQYADQNPVAYQFCLSFVNWYYVQQSNVAPGPATGEGDVTHVQFPLSVEIYDDLEACLNLIS